ncbi:MAG: arabinosyltransferase C-terminal domain-containing protein, partial [Pseudonocardiaceae bacterium]
SGAFALAAGRPAPVPAPVPGTQVWHDSLDNPGSAPDTGPLTNPGGLLITPWYTLPAGDPGASTLLVPLLGIRAGQALILEYATTAGPDPEVAGLVGVPVDHTVSRAEWQQTPIALEALGPQRPTQVRLVIGTQIGGADSWLAVGQPRLAGWRSLSAVSTGASVYVDQLTAALLPCLNQVTVTHGIAQAPQVLVLSDEGFGRGFLDLGFELRRGGTQIPMRRTATAVRIPSRLVPNGPPSLPWGRVERVIYDHPVGLVDVRVDQVHRAGWTRLPTLADDSYHGNS